MFFSTYPENTKQIRSENSTNVKNVSNNRNDFLKPMMTNESIPLNYNHSHYEKQNYDIERTTVSTRKDYLDETKKPIQSSFQNNYYTMSFEDLQHQNTHEINKFLTRNPANTRRDNIEKQRNTDTQTFLTSQGGMMSNYSNFNVENTRKYKDELNSSIYVPMPRTMAIPKEHV